MAGVSESDTRRISEKGWVVIPQELREKYRLEKGTPVRFVDYGGLLSIVPVASDPVTGGFGLLRGKNLIGRLLEEHRREREAEGRT